MQEHELHLQQLRSPYQLHLPEQLANMDVNLGDLEGNLGIGSKDF